MVCKETKGGWTRETRRCRAKKSALLDEVIEPLQEDVLFMNQLWLGKLELVPSWVEKLLRLCSVA